MMVDSEVGQILDAIKRDGEEENTIVVFASDNGCSPSADFDALLAKGHNPSYIFRGYKADLFDGGHRVPCIAKWPLKLKPHQASQTICLTDFMATFAAVTGYRLKDNEGEDSFNLLPLFLDSYPEKFAREATVHHSINGSFTIRKGEWKLLFSPGSGGWSYPRPGKDDKVIAALPPIQLYNMKTDPGEKENLSGKYPDIVKELRTLMIKYIEDGRSTVGAPQKNDGVKIVLNQFE
jgi:arylsulfatase A-like enzyme